MDQFILLWIAQIALGGVIAVTNDKQPHVSDKAQKARTLAVYGGLVPCVGIMIFMQLLWFGLYRFLLARENSVSRRLPDLPTSFGVETERPRPTPKQAGQRENPFL